MATALDDNEHLERELLRRGVGALAAERHRCGDCHRTPLVGEQVYLFADARVLCELCRAMCADEPAGSELVRHSEHGQTVRLTRRAA